MLHFGVNLQEMGQIPLLGVGTASKNVLGGVKGFCWAVVAPWGCTLGPTSYWWQVAKFTWPKL